MTSSRPPSEHLDATSLKSVSSYDSVSMTSLNRLSEDFSGSPDLSGATPPPLPSKHRGSTSSREDDIAMPPVSPSGPRLPQKHSNYSSIVIGGNMKLPAANATNSPPTLGPKTRNTVIGNSGTNAIDVIININLANMRYNLLAFKCSCLHF